MKRFIITIVLGIVTIVLPLHAFVVDGLNYEITSPDNVTLIAKWPTYSGSIVVPKTVDYEGVTYTVNSIGPAAFKNSEFLNSVSLQNTIISIGSSAFENCTSLKTIKIPSNVTEMGNRVFAGCTSLSSVTFNSNLLSEIPNSAFYNCSSLKDISIPENVSAIRSLAFANSGLKTITVSPQVKVFEPFAFDNCRNLTAVKIRDLRAWCDIDFFNATDNPLYYARALVLNGQQLDHLVIPDDITTIKPYVFAGSGASTLEIPPSVTTIDLSAFLYCYYITDVTIPNNVTELIISNIQDDEHPFPNMVSLSIGKGIKHVPATTFGFCYRLRKLTLMEGVMELGYDAFKYTKIVDLVLPGTMRALRSSFSNCANLKAITINSGLTTLDHNVFSGCTNLHEIHSRVVNPNNVEFIGTRQFEGVDTETCILYVPENSVALYKSHPKWNVFKNIVPDVNLPDVNRSGITDVEDLNYVVNYILRNDDPGCNSVAADVNNDSMVDVEDVNVIVNRVLNLQ